MVLAAALCAVLVFWLIYTAPNRLEVDFLDIGQGDAELIKTPSGQNILIDGGPDNTVIRRLGENMAWWDRTIDLMILTHPHDDHVNGLNDVLERYKVKKILYTGVIHNSPGYIKWLQKIRDDRVPLMIVDRPQTISLGENCRLNILYPRSSLAGKGIENLNNSSIVVKLVYGESKFLFTGDAEVEVEQELLREGVDLSAQALKTGHHGSDTSSGEDFLAAVKPSIVVIEVGKDNDFGHPSPAVIKRLERAGVRIFRTDLDGTIILESNGNEIRQK